MIIGIDASRANQKSKTGTEWYSYILIKKFAELDNNNQFRLYVKNPPAEDLLNLPANFQVKVLGWPINRLWHQGRISLEMVFAKPDVLFVPAHTIPIIHPQKTITTCHDVGFAKFPQLYSPTELKYHSWSMRYAIEKAKKIITVSQFSKQEIVDIYKADPDKIEVIYHGVDKSFFQPQSENKVNEILDNLGISRPYIFFIGRLEKKKNIVNQIKAFTLLKEKYQIPHQLVLGGNPGFGFEEIKKEIIQSKYKQDIKLIGYVKAKELPALYSGADLFWFVTNYEGFGMPILEAQTCQTPIIASNVCSIPEIGGGGVAQVRPDDIDQIAGVTDKVIRDKNFRDKLIQAGLANIQRFDWNSCAQKTLKLLQQ